MNHKVIPITGIIVCLLYFLVTFLFIITSSRNWLAAMEIMIMISGVFMLFLILALPSGGTEMAKILRTASIVLVAGCMILTVTAHFVNLAVTEQLMKSGVDVPDYFQIGKWPSAEMAVDYLAWGMFMGLAFLSAALCVPNKNGQEILQKTLYICGILCLVGFFGSLFHENLWYVAPMGYGIGSLLICIELLHIKRQEQKAV